MIPPSELFPFIRIIIEVFVTCKILSTETILSGYTHTQPTAHTSILFKADDDDDELMLNVLRCHETY